ncbi:MAG: glycosyltransferase [Akkermansia sp.]|nr:glycosyltransferase [Akkermansia sp.]
MKIAIATYRELNPLIGGVERISCNLAEKWIDAGHEVIALCLRKDGREEHESRYREYFLPKPDEMTTLENQVYIEQCILEEKVDILLNQVIVEPAFAKVCISAARSCGVKVVSCMHYDIYQHVKDVENSFFIPEKNGWHLTNWCRDVLLWLRFRLYRKRQLIRRAESFMKQSADQSDALVLLSHGAMRQCLQWSDVSKFHYIPNGLEINGKSVNLTHKQKKVIYVGRLEYGLKRVDRFIRIWAAIEKTHPDWSATIVGDGPYRYLFEKLASSLRCERLTFAGFQSPESYYREASVLCLTSTSEGFGMVLVEAMLHACVPVLFDSFPAASEIVDDGINGYLVNPFNKNHFAEKLSLLMEHPDVLGQMEVAAVEKSRKYDINDISAQWLRLFRSLLSEQEN